MTGVAAAVGLGEGSGVETAAVTVKGWAVVVRAWAVTVTGWAVGLKAMAAGAEAVGLTAAGAALTAAFFLRRRFLGLGLAWGLAAGLTAGAAAAGACAAGAAVSAASRGAARKLKPAKAATAMKMPCFFNETSQRRSLMAATFAPAMPFVNPICCDSKHKQSFLIVTSVTYRPAGRASP